jgi:hypothetical protein
MKTILFALFVSIFPLFGMSQNPQAVTPLLHSYLTIKDALIEGNVKDASKNAESFVQILRNTEGKSLSSAEAKTLSVVKEKLNRAAEQIAGSNDIVKQREYFSSLSTDIYSLVKASTPMSTPVYQMYCPMKKAYWLSNEEAIKNPYYGKQMLSCGKIVQTLK